MALTDALPENSQEKINPLFMGAAPRGMNAGLLHALAATLANEKLGPPRTGLADSLPEDATVDIEYEMQDFLGKEITITVSVKDTNILNPPTKNKKSKIKVALGERGLKVLGDVGVELDSSSNKIQSIIFTQVSDALMNLLHEELPLVPR